MLFNNICLSKCPDGYKVDSTGVICVLIPINNTNNGSSGGNGSNGGNGNGGNNGGNGGNNGSGNGGNGSSNGGGGTIIIDNTDDFIDTNNKTQTYFAT